MRCSSALIRQMYWRPSYLGGQQLRRCYRIPSETTTTPRPIATDLSILKAAATSVLSQETPRVRWAGVFGDFAVGAENDYSVVDVIILYDSDKVGHNRWPPQLRDLDKILPVAWGRNAVVEELTIKKVPHFWCIVQFLQSRVIFGSDDDPIVMQVRQEWLDILVNGAMHFKSLIRDINDITTTIQGKSPEKLCSDSRLRQTVLERIMAVLDTIDRDLVNECSSSPFKELLQFDGQRDYDLIQDRMKRIIKGNQTQSKHSVDQSDQLCRSLWRLATASGRGTLDRLGKWIEMHVIAGIEEAVEQRGHVQSLTPKERIHVEYYYYA
ncbi:hypothetical protein H112_08978 [Trichophyton rubrum D6]|uniref:Uncharacterized protein n=2 Tax=Trichophyton rubrum TaxID=5551 RepID=F2SCZ5_TRIRC|nr:uncharacterized protein TERG_01523 [Trichophyton rubrum CBS 118892]EZF09692.1 hypothetical protein H100_09001 [Trichophyton rubrum MR850]EZF36521.1 hypothetical protein H102_08959 [Trichophyton rubrum CBS 100081]EZF47199.1 hypothetical protein H103_08982 [Trichophyton rubrum CBS 288.86]EZF57881.1 hypothetical protein H104_08930 [Trichophyton rubrum CBS 289.86]EZF79171.1 hypothetical protein H110_08982 [Trichophyton rubrum MR1448]EZF89788.1 hypothetical protein H113_09047 [Trichophyton rubr